MNIDRPSNYFPHLDAIRFFAAYTVIIHHTEQFKSIYNWSHYYDYAAISLLGKTGVYCFYVLSGFLITTLLLQEHTTHQTIDIKKFYKKRILRIWPLYFFIILLAYFVLPYLSLLQVPGYHTLHNPIAVQLMFFLLLMPNVAIELFGPVIYANQTWSIGAEEQFYLLWPWALNCFQKHIGKFILMGIVLYHPIGWFINQLPDFYGNYVLISFWKGFYIHSILFGALMAYVYQYEPQDILKILFHRATQWIIALALMLFILFGIRMPYLHVEIYSLLFGILILNAARNINFIFNFEFSVLSYLGKISYGMYMYHCICIVLVMRLLMSYEIQSNWILYPLVFVLTTMVSSLSYHTLERFFMRLR